VAEKGLGHKMLEGEQKQKKIQKKRKKFG